MDHTGTGRRALSLPLDGSCYWLGLSPFRWMEAVVGSSRRVLCVQERFAAVTLRVADGLLAGDEEAVTS
eukprot:222558-Prorocentrum_minimum.AAC.1